MEIDDAMIERVANEVIDSLGLPAVEQDRDPLDLILLLASGPRRIRGRNVHAIVVDAIRRATKEADVATTIEIANGFVRVTRFCGRVEEGDRLRVEIVAPRVGVLTRDEAIELRDALTRVLEASPVDGRWSELEEDEEIG